MAILRNVSYTAASQGVCVGLQFVVGVVLARLLSPEDYGLIGLTGVFTGFASLFADLGLGSAIIKSKEVSDEDLSLVFWLNVVIGLLLTVLIVVASPGIAWFYHEPRLRGIASAISISFAITAPGIVSASLLNKSLSFGKLAIAEVISAAVTGVVGIYLAFHGLGVYSLVIMSVAGQAIRTILVCYFAEWLPRLPSRSARLGQMMAYGGNLSGFNAINYWARNGDNLLIGKFCGAAELGIYGRAYSLLLFPVSQIHQVLGRVVFPTLSSRHNADQEIGSAYLLACQAVALVTFPAMIALLVVADDFVYALYGTKWLAAIPVIRILAIVGMGNSVCSSVGWIYTSVGRTDLMFRWGLFATSIMLLSFVAGLHWGAVGVAASYTAVSYLVLWYPLWRIAGGLIGLSFRTLMLNLWKPFVAALAMGFILYALKLTLHNRPPVRLALCVLVGTSTYFAFIQVLRVPACRYIYDRIRR